MTRHASPAAREAARKEACRRDFNASANHIAGCLQTADSSALRRLALGARAGDEQITADKLIRMEIASRGLGKDLAWVGFEKAWTAWGLTADDRIAQQKLQQAGDAEFAAQQNS